MKKYLLQFFILFAVVISASSVKANGVNITIEGNKSDFGSNAIISGNKTYVPMRELFEGLGASVQWKDETKSAIAVVDNSIISFNITENTVVKDNKTYLSDCDCKIIEGKTYIPLRSILELLGYKVDWNGENEKIDISHPSLTYPEPKPQLPEYTDEPELFNNEFEMKVLELINIERTKNGLQALQIDENLSSVARNHSIDMYERSFFSHTNPDGLSPFDRMNKHGISYRYAAENIAIGQSSPEQVVNSWMNSEGHRKNILNPDFNKIGIGYYRSDKNYVHYWTQCFTD